MSRPVYATTAEPARPAAAGLRVLSSPPDAYVRGCRWGRATRALHVRASSDARVSITSMPGAVDGVLAGGHLAHEHQRAHEAHPARTSTTNPGHDRDAQQPFGVSRALPLGWPRRLALRPENDVDEPSSLAVRARSCRGCATAVRVRRAVPVSTRDEAPGRLGGEATRGRRRRQP